MPPQSPSASTQSSQSLLNASSANLSKEWFPDSGATHHVTHDFQNLDLGSASAADPSQNQVYLGNGQGLFINSVGSYTFTSPFNSSQPLVLKNLLHVPSITKNLVSVSQFAKDNSVFFEFHPHFCLVKSQATSEVLLRGVLGSDGLYTFGSLPVFSPSKSSSSFSSIPCINNTNAPSLYSVWHCRLGHPHFEVLKAALTHCNISISDKMSLDSCTACCLGKAHRLPSHTSHTVYSQPLELLFCDIWGPAPIISSCGYKYVLTCVDAFSRYTWIIPLKAKSDTFQAIVNFRTMAELQFHTKLKAVQTDCGGEFRPLTKFFTSVGILHRVICPHTHHQNGSVERKHRHLVETGLTLLAHAQLPMSFWDHAFLTAIYLINRMQTSVLSNKSPFPVLYKQIPDYKFLKVFGCACFLFLRPFNSHKFDYHSKECVFLGYSPSHKGYKCLSSNGRIYISKDVLFHETRFPYSSLFPSQKSKSQSAGAPISAMPPILNFQQHHSLPNSPTTSHVSLSPPSPQSSSNQQSHTSINSLQNDTSQPLGSDLIPGSAAGLPIPSVIPNTHPMQTSMFLLLISWLIYSPSLSLSPDFSF